MAYTQEQLTQLQNALATGTLRVDYDGKTITYRSLAEIKEAIRVVEAGLAKTSGTTRHTRSFGSFVRG